MGTVNEITGRISQIRIYPSILEGSEQMDILRKSIIGRKNTSAKVLKCKQAEASVVEQRT